MYDGGRRTLCSGCRGRVAIVGRSVCGRCMRSGVGRMGPGWREVRAQVLAEETECWICGGEDLDDGDHWSVDHVRERRHGGDNSRANLRRAHLSCNASRR